MTTPHRLEPLLNPRSVALVGVSERSGSVGEWALSTFLRGGFGGDLYLVNPRYDEMAERRCYHDLGDLPVVPDMAVLNVGSARMESLVDQAIELAIPALTIFDYCDLDEDQEPDLMARLREKTTRAGVHVCGGGGMGFYNFDTGVHATYYRADHLVPGHITLLAHSGSVFTVLGMADPRHRFNLIVSAGSEIATSVDAFLDYAVQLPSTRVVAMFVETIRNPSGFIAALEHAQERDVPVVVCKVGKTAKSAAFAKTHTGAIAGNQAALEATLDRYGALQVDNLNELMSSAALLAQGRRAGPGGLGAILDSGGLRQLLADLAVKVGVPLAELSDETIKAIEEHLPHTLVADNPLDAAGPFTYDYESVFRNCLRAIVDEPDTALGWFEFDATDRFNPFPPQVETAKHIGSNTDKPFVVVNSSSATLNTQVAVELLEAGVPLINGVEAALVAVRNLFLYRDYRRRPKSTPPVLAGGAHVDAWCARLTSGERLSEVEALSLLNDFGVPTVSCARATHRESLIEAAEEIGYPLALKTAAGDIDHKTDVDAVHLNLANLDELSLAYEDLSTRLGGDVTVAAMAPAGVEIGFGMVRDPQFGALIMVSAGGTLIELLNDRVTMLAPVDEREARRHIEKLGVYGLLEGARGAGRADIDALVEALVSFSVLAACLGDVIAEMDVNPVMVSEEGLLALDALVVPSGPS